MFERNLWWAPRIFKRAFFCDCESQEMRGPLLSSPCGPPALPCWSLTQTLMSLCSGAAYGAGARRSLPGGRAVCWQVAGWVYPAPGPRPTPLLRSHWRRQLSLSALGRGRAAAVPLQRYARSAASGAPRCLSPCAPTSGTELAQDRDALGKWRQDQRLWVRIGCTESLVGR